MKLDWVNKYISYLTKNRFVVIIVALVLAILIFLMGWGIGHSAYGELNAIYEELQTRNDELIVRLDNIIAEREELQTKYEELQAEYEEALSKELESELPYFKALGKPVHLINDSGAEDQPWQEVVSFLERDTTDEEAYASEHECGFFAEELHNRAEYYGFKTALVVVEFETGELHALNAFNTVDYGLVYVDCGGRERACMPTETDDILALSPVGHFDKVAYIEKGKKMGLISLGYNEQDFSYNWYQQCRHRFEVFMIDWADFGNYWASFCKEYNALPSVIQDWIRDMDTPFRGQPVDIRYKMMDDYGVDPAHTAQLKWQWTLLTKTKISLKSEWEQVCGYAWKESESPVTDVKIYW